ncbi:MAG: tRNA-dihydrouridine synthase [Bifidobacteriaceae bacterium]|jgi:nifR3 family TIM-barrel protein|nr:tRNA-dihydrouridine synthase [Bifidobacteriaceae bacterium]
MLPNYKFTLSPMAGLTNSPYRLLCQGFYDQVFLISEMVNARSLVENNPKAKSLAYFSPKEKYRCIQIFSKFPNDIASAVNLIVENNLADQIDLNFGCPVKKITKSGGGAMIPANKSLYSKIIAEAVKVANGKVPITVKLRLGIDESNITYIQAGLIAEDLGCKMVTLHARYLKQMYKGQADWSKIADLKKRLSIKVFGNGDIKTPNDAKKAFDLTGVDGIAVGRGALGRPWIFASIAQTIGLTDLATNLSSVLTTEFDKLDRILQIKAYKQINYLILQQANMLIDYFDSELLAIKNLRKYLIWYFKGYSIGRNVRAKLVRVQTLFELKQILGEL